MTFIIIGNILTALGMTLFFLSSFLKTKKKILIFQTGNHTLSSIGQLFLNQYSGAIQDFVSIIRNICIIFNKNTKFLNYFFIILGLALGVGFNVWLNYNKTFDLIMGFLPVFASLQYSVIILLPNVKVYQIKLSMILSCICWTIYGLIYLNYSMAISNFIILIANVVILIRAKINK